jgi:hypothetical protein
MAISAYILLCFVCSVELNTVGSNPLEYQYIVCHGGKTYTVSAENIRYKPVIISSASCCQPVYLCFKQLPQKFGELQSDAGFFLP